MKSSLGKMVLEMWTKNGLQCTHGSLVSYWEFYSMKIDLNYLCICMGECKSRIWIALNQNDSYVNMTISKWNWSYSQSFVTRINFVQWCGHFFSLFYRFFERGRVFMVATVILSKLIWVKGTVGTPMMTLQCLKT